MERILTVTGKDLSAVIISIQKVRKIWARLSWILGREMTKKRALEWFYLAVVQ